MKRIANPATTVVTAHDMRESSVPLARAFAQGVISRGLDVRASDHSTNNVTLASDGWLYVAVVMDLDAEVYRQVLQDGTDHRMLDLRVVADRLDP